MILVGMYSLPNEKGEYSKVKCFVNNLIFTSDTNRVEQSCTPRDIPNAKKYSKRWQPAASEVLTLHLRQRSLPHWSSYFVYYRDVYNDQFGLSYFNWKATVCHAYQVTYPAELAFPDIGFSATQARMMKFLRIGNVLLPGYVHDPVETSDMELVDGKNYQVLRTGCYPFIKYHCSSRAHSDLTGENQLYTFLKVLNLGIPTLAYGIGSWFLIKFSEDVLMPDGTIVKVYFMNKEIPDAMY